MFAVQCIFTAFWAWPELYGRGKLSKWVICNPYEQLMQECTLNKDESVAEATWLRVSVPSGRHIPGDLISGLGQSPGRLRARGQSGWSPWTLAVCSHPLSRGGLRSVAPGQGKCPQGQPSLDGGEWGCSTLLMGEGPLWSTGPASAQLHAHRWYRGSWVDTDALNEGIGAPPRTGHSTDIAHQGHPYMRRHAVGTRAKCRDT